jgi:hypothetical protein
MAKKQGRTVEVEVVSREAGKPRVVEPEAAPVASVKPRCPRCGMADTIATSTQEGVQYRKCRRPICRWRYKVPLIGNASAL